LNKRATEESKLDSRKSIKGHEWHPEGKFWLFSNTNGTLKKILKVFEGEEIHLDPALQTQFQSKSHCNPALSHKVRRKQSHLEDLRRELISRKYSYKTVKGYLYYNRDFLSFIGKSHLEIADNGIKGYLVYLTEEKQGCNLNIKSGNKCHEVLLWDNAEKEVYQRS